MVLASLVCAVLLMASSVAISTSWVDDGGDGTCGSVVRTEVWTSEWNRDECGPIMVSRAVWAGALLLSGLWVGTQAIRRRPADVTVLVVLTGAGIGSLLLDEALRCGGLVE